MSPSIKEKNNNNNKKKIHFVNNFAVFARKIQPGYTIILLECLLRKVRSFRYTRKNTLRQDDT